MNLVFIMCVISVNNCGALADLSIRWCLCSCLRREVSPQAPGPRRSPHARTRQALFITPDAKQEAGRFRDRSFLTLAARTLLVHLRPSVACLHFLFIGLLWVPTRTTRRALGSDPLGEDGIQALLVFGSLTDPPQRITHST